MAQLEFETKWLIYAKPDAVFDALTNNKTLNRWSGGKSFVDLKKGGKVEMFDGWATGNVMSFEKGKSLTYTWKIESWGKKATPSIVEYTFSKHKAGTELIIKHSGFPNMEEASSHKQGWETYVFDPLNELFTGGLG